MAVSHTAASLLVSALLCVVTTKTSVAAWHLPAIPSPSRCLGSFSAPKTMRMMSDNGGGSGKKVTVLGGTGFVGSRVCKILQEQGADVTSVSKTGKVPSWCAGEDWTKSINWATADLLGGGSEQLDAAVGKPESIVSCVGVVGFDKDELLKGNGDANVAGFESAKRGGNVKHVAFVSVASEVSDCEENWLPEFFGGYFEGKRMAEKAALEVVNGDEKSVCIVKPSFIYGGDEFGLFPPRVNDAYGSAVEELLSLGLLRFFADVTPGLIKVALRPPSAVEAVAGTCAKAAMGEVSGELDGTDAINKAAGQPDPTGLTEAIKWAGEKTKDAYDWAKVEVPKFVEWTKEKIDEKSK